MKKLLTIISLMVLMQCHKAFAQYDKEDKSKWSLSIAYNSVEAQMDQKLFDTWVYPSANYYAYFGDKKDKSSSFSIIPKYRVDQDLFLRLEFGMTSINLFSHYNGSGDTLTQQQGHIGATADITKIDTIRQKIYRYSLGIQYIFFKKKIIETYCGASLSYFKYSKMKWEDFIVDNQYPNNLNHSYNKATTPGGFATGIGALAGVNVYLRKWISVGGELSYFLLYYQLGGKQDGVYERGYPDGTIETEYWAIYNNASDGIQFSKVMPSFNISIQF